MTTGRAPVQNGEAPCLPAEASPPNPVLERLHALVRKGYKPQIGTGRDTDSIVLRHLGKAPDLVLQPDGTVAPLDGRWPRHKRKVPVPRPFAPDQMAERLRFLQFLETVPEASLRDRTRPWRQRFIYLPVVLAFLIFVNLLVTAMVFDW